VNYEFEKPGLYKVDAIGEKYVFIKT